ncbi:MAG: methyltransferase domain-containing protein [Alphaproteobacteria bacterium]
MSRTISTEAVVGHYAPASLLDRVKDAIRAAGFADDAILTVDDLAAFDQFHTRGIEATVDLAALAGVSSEMRVLDVGAGIGGPARHLAARHGCRVTGVDLTDAFVVVARHLTERMRLAERVSFETADATRLPFADGSFDLVWCQHVVMNIADRPALYREMHRVLRPGGRVATYDVVTGEGGPLHYPAPWAEHPDQSHVISARETARLITEAGLRIERMEDATAPVLAMLAKGPPPVPPKLSLATIMESVFVDRISNHGRNLREDRVRVAMIVAARPA